MKEILTQAPKGGAVSRLNGEFYAGGQFMPELGLPKGAKRKVHEVVNFRTPRTSNISEIKVVCGWHNWRVTYRMADDWSVRHAFAGSRDECVTFAQNVLAEKARWYESQGLMVHPTKFIVEEGANNIC